MKSVLMLAGRLASPFPPDRSKYIGFARLAAVVHTAGRVEQQWSFEVGHGAREGG